MSTTRFVVCAVVVSLLLGAFGVAGAREMNEPQSEIDARSILEDVGRELAEYELGLFGESAGVVPDSVQVLTNLSYGPRVHQKLDLYLPQSTPSHGIVVYAHPGGWCCGDKSAVPSYMVDLTSHGWAVASISYTLYTHSRGSWPANLYDYKRATRWLRSQATQYSLNPEVVVAAGASAGGHLATLAANTAGRSFEPPNLPEDLAAQRPDYQGVISLVGPVNLVRFYKSGAAWAPIAGAMVGCGTRCTDTQLTPASPVHQLHRGSPPHYMVYGVNDALVNIGELWDYQNRWNSIFLGEAREKLWYEAPNHDHNVEARHVNVPRLHQFLSGVVSGAWVTPPIPSRCGFQDVPTNAYYAQAACWMKLNDITTGFGGDTRRFAPSERVTRGQMAAFLWRAVGRPSAPASCGFRDVPTNAYYARAACWMKQEKITTGFGGDTRRFAPREHVTRGQVAAFLYRSRNRLG